ncbi:dihydrofolate reductase family protein [Actinomadura sp. 3N407]|uniref:dihydrofolate reductase family protein n=1 Tax=Actinomadura sp. 3N407 TaxID=3457423 RepID=UPI003FCE384D
MPDGDAEWQNPTRHKAEGARHDGNRNDPATRPALHQRRDPGGHRQENDTPKVVISDTLTESPWKNAVVAGGDLAETVRRLKAEPGKDMITSGGGTLARDLIAKGLLDELHLFVNPVALGAGMPVFPDHGVRHRLHLVSARPFDCGITALHFEPVRA